MTEQEQQAREYIEADVDSTFLPILLDGMWKFIDNCTEVLNHNEN